MRAQLDTVVDRSLKDDISNLALYCQTLQGRLNKVVTAAKQVTLINDD